MSITEVHLDCEYPYTPAEAAEVLRCSVDHVWSLCREEKLKHRRNGNRIFIRRQDLIDYIGGQLQGGE